MTKALSREDCAALDAADPLAPFLARFRRPRDLLYFDGNSLGMLPWAASRRVVEALEKEWGEGLIESWTEAGWIDLPERVGAKIARLIGAEADEVIATDSTSINLFKLLAAGLKLRPGRRVILTEAGNFPTDIYMAEGLAHLLGDVEVRLAEDVAAAITEDVAVVALSHVDYRSSALADMAGLTAAAHAKGALVLWDLSHSAGALPVALGEADFAVGCGYKFLNGGPGAPAYVFVAKRWHPMFIQPLAGLDGPCRALRVRGPLPSGAWDQAGALRHAFGAGHDRAGRRPRSAARGGHGPHPGQGPGADGSLRPPDRGALPGGRAGASDAARP